MKFWPSLSCVKFSDFKCQYLQNYPVYLNPIWYVGTCPRDFYESGVTRPVNLFLKNGAGVKLAYGSIANESCRKVHYNTKKATMGSETPVCLYKTSGAAVKFTNSQNITSYISVPIQSISTQLTMRVYTFKSYIRPKP